MIFDVLGLVVQVRLGCLSITISMQLCLGFAEASKGSVRGCVGAVDGLLIKIQRPPNAQHPKSLT
jgi:hypothetical protein